VDAVTQLADLGTAAPDGGIAVVSRIPNSMELWWITNTGAIQGAHWSEGGTWNSYQLAPPGTAAPEGRIAVVSRITNSMELWWIARDGVNSGCPLVSALNPSLHRRCDGVG
jgi:hypothetical protein